MRFNARRLKSILPLAALLLHIPASGTNISEMFSDSEIDKIKAVRSIRTAGRMEMGGLSGTMEVIFAAPNMMYASYDMGLLKFTQAFDGQTAWIRDQNDQVLELTGTEKKVIISGAYLIGMSFLIEGRIPGEEFYLGDTTFDDAEYAVFSATPEGGDPLVLYFNKDNGRLEVFMETLDELDILTYSSDFRDVGGIEFAFKAVTKSSVPQFNSVLETTEIELNVPVDESLFEIRTEKPTDFHFPEDADSVNVPFVFYGGHLFVEASVNGNAKVRFILDSGAGTNIIDSTYAEEMGLESAGSLPAKGLAGYGSASLTELDSLSIGEITLFGQTAGILELSGLGLKTPDKLGGIIGYDLMSRFPFRIDYAAGRVILHNPEKFTPPDSAWGVDFEFFMKVPIAPAYYGGIRGDFLIDLGNPVGLVLHRSFVDEHNLTETFTDIKDMRAGISGIGGFSSVYAATGAGFKIGAMETESLPLMVAEAEAGVVESRKIDGNIGNLFLRGFSIMMDYANKKIYILPVK
ncbi:MAG: aspartyl protease family protein [Candidatus Zixiibacteriota bacterium]|nr:MAG: aspartyl protease family protein [candidate division Zixibacteria bacterium]